MPDRLGIVTVLFLAVQAVAVVWVASGERPPAVPDLSNLPGQFGEWRMLHEDPLESDVVGNLKADALVSRTYGTATAGKSAGLFIAWFQSQRNGDRQPHSPQVCLPGAGWTSESTGEVTLVTTTGPITINRYTIVSRRDRAVVLYWYQMPRRVIAGEWAAKFWLLPDAIRDRRTDTALIRVLVYGTNSEMEAAQQTACRFATELYPVLRAKMPSL
jgi:EpsI family protein